MGIFDKLRGRGAGRNRRDVNDNHRYLREWTAAHVGVEAFVEPQTTVTEVTVVLVANDGEWTRRRVGGRAGALRLSDELKIPVYDVQKVGYPQRMRDYDAKKRIERRRAVRDNLDEV